MPQLHETPLGKKFFEHDLPSLVIAINRLANAIEKSKTKESEQK